MCANCLSLNQETFPRPFLELDEQINTSLELRGTACFTLFKVKGAVHPKIKVHINTHVFL